MDMIVADPQGGFKEVEPIKGTPVPKETVLQNIRDSALFDIPVLEKQPSREGTLVFVAGGPSLRGFIPEIKQRNGDFILTSNNTHDFLIENGIVPDACLIFDPKKRVVDYVKHAREEVTYYLGVTVVKGVYERFHGFNTRKVLIAYGMETEDDLKLQNELYPKVSMRNYLVGGTMTPLRAMPFACLLGFKRIEFYGLDSCFGSTQIPIITEDDPRFNDALQTTKRCYEDSDSGKKYVIAEADDGGFFYAYKKDRQEDVHIVEVGPRRFWSSPGFAYQAKQVVYWKERLAGKLEVIVHGDNLTTALLEAEERKKAHIKSKIGDKRWTDAYGAMQRTLHDQEGIKYGEGGVRNFELIARALIGMYSQLKRPIEWMDYGCGNGALAKEIESSIACVKVTRYDPFHPLWRDQPEPGKQDFITCMDVMEHVEEECIDNTIDYIADHTRFGAVFSICCEEALKTLPDGRNAHISLHLPQWWKEKLSRRFQIAETSMQGVNAILVCVGVGATERLHEERKAA